MTATTGTKAEVWGSTWVPGPPPIDALADGTGYSVAWVRVADGPMLQVVVEGGAAPEPGTPGRVRSMPVDDEQIDVFTPDNGVGA